MTISCLSCDNASLTPAEALAHKKEHNIIAYYIKSVYGRDLEYIADKDLAKIIGGLTGTGTLCEYQKPLLAKLGFTFEQVLPL